MKDSARFVAAALLLAACPSSSNPAAECELEPSDEMVITDEVAGTVRITESKTPDNYVPGVPKALPFHTNLEAKFSVEQPFDWDDGVVVRATSFALYEPLLTELWVGIQNFGTEKLCDHFLQVVLEDAEGDWLFDESEFIHATLYDQGARRPASCLEPGAEAAVKLTSSTRAAFDPAKIAKVVVVVHTEWDLDVDTLKPFVGPRVKKLTFERIWDDSTSLTGELQAGDQALSHMGVRFFVRDRAGYFRDDAMEDAMDVEPNGVVEIDTVAGDTPPDQISDVLAIYWGETL